MILSALYDTIWLGTCYELEVSFYPFRRKNDEGKRVRQRNKEARHVNIIEKPVEFRTWCARRG